jgi:rRNA maturation endonuclease Nob1
MKPEDAARQTTASTYEPCIKCKKVYTDEIYCEKCGEQVRLNLIAEAKSKVTFIHRGRK